ncbi:hypothetical protein [Deefgea sp. CFH1-16]|uniref:hypothetical protein n=1 Tax=Deefgea sp. CFH1-16 TaxID=2675457 RepID=UPI0015F586C7|nr:hypothetical protein [Deefgea sp. CFH1-16]MBM5574952.1 hypothetical protein [Deefgea sp. CFH1-16]
MTLKNYPSRMYKYLANDRIDVIKNCIIRYSCLGDFNDPFEGQPNIQLLVSAEQAKSLFKTQLLIEAARQFPEIPSSEKARISSGEILDSLFEKIENDAPELHEHIEKQRSTVLNNICSVQKSLAALCLSEVPDSLLMWASLC